MFRRTTLWPVIAATFALMIGSLFVASEASAQGRVLGYGRAFGRGDYGGGTYGTRTYISGLSPSGNATWGYFPGVPYPRSGYTYAAPYGGIAVGSSGIGNHGHYIYGHSQLASGTMYATGPVITPLPPPTFAPYPGVRWSPRRQ